jgi:hypothetical protein
MFKRVRFLLNFEGSFSGHHSVPLEAVASSDLLWTAAGCRGFLRSMTSHRQQPTCALWWSTQDLGGLIFGYPLHMIHSLSITSHDNNNNNHISYLNDVTSSCAGSAAEAAATRKEAKYAEISCNYHFFSLAFETFGPINQVGSDFLSALGHRLSLISDDKRESSFLFQRLYVAIQRFNFVCFCNSFGNLPAQLFDQP